jgi:hypothetical protein
MLGATVHTFFLDSGYIQGISCWGTEDGMPTVVDASDSVYNTALTEGRVPKRETKKVLLSFETDVLASIDELVTDERGRSKAVNRGMRCVLPILGELLRMEDDEIAEVERRTESRARAIMDRILEEESST